MIHGSLHAPTTCEPLRLHPAWRLALAWLKGMPAEIPLGTHYLHGESIFAMVQEYDTLPADQCRFESHREHVDLQYTIAGREIIEWAPRGTLRPDGDFSVERDVGFWLPPEGPSTALVQVPGHFAVFYPEDAHRPKVRIPGHPHVRKLVIKVPVRLLA